MNKTKHDQPLLEELKKVFDEYADSYMSGEHELDRNFVLKQAHSIRVMEEACLIAGALHLTGRDYLLAGCAGLLHDIGRFEQFRRHRTFVDIRSENHGELGKKILSENNFADFLFQEERRTLLAAVANHNSRQIPAGLSPAEVALTRLVRDADKLDIMRVLLKHYQRPDDNDAVLLGLEDSEQISPAVKLSASRGETVAISELRTVTDFKIAQLMWVYDLNFHHSVIRYSELGYHTKLRAHLPESSDVMEIFGAVCQYLEQRANSTVGTTYC